MNPSCCRSPLGVANFPPWAHSALAIVVVVAVAYLMHLGWKWMASPLARHAAKTCNPLSCQLCIDEESNARVNTYVRQAREREQARQRKAERDA